MRGLDRVEEGIAMALKTTESVNLSKVVPIKNRLAGRWSQAQTNVTN
jgi:hypothetical protein